MVEGLHMICPKEQKSKVQMPTGTMMGASVSVSSQGMLTGHHAVVWMTVQSGETRTCA